MSKERQWGREIYVRHARIYHEKVNKNNCDDYNDLHVSCSHGNPEADSYQL